MPDNYSLLNLGGLTSLIKNVLVSKWGTEVSFECIYDPQGQRTPYVLVFEECREIKWDVHDPEEASEAEADLFGIYLGEDAHRKPALIHTDIFEISLLYGSFHLFPLHPHTPTPLQRTIHPEIQQRPDEKSYRLWNKLAILEGEQNNI